MRKEEVHMIFHRYDIIEAELKIRDNSGSIQKKKKQNAIQGYCTYSTFKSQVFQAILLQIPIFI